MESITVFVDPVIFAVQLLLIETGCPRLSSSEITKGHETNVVFSSRSDVFLPDMTHAVWRRRPGLSPHLSAVVALSRYRRSK